MIVPVFSTIFHLFFNSFIVFLGVASAIELFLFLFRVKNARIRVFCRLLPIVKLPLDVILYLLSAKHLFFNLNPFSCEKYFLDFIVKWFCPNGVTVSYNSVPDFFVMHLPESLIVVLLSLGGLLTVILLGMNVLQIIKAKRYLKSIFASSQPCTRKLTNEKLINNLKNTVILTSPLATIPFATRQKTIIFPETIVNSLSQEAFEAIVAHEYEHLRWKDPLVKVSCSLIGAIFWWVPTYWWRKKIEWDQEAASDSYVRKFGIKAPDLAQGILSVMNSTEEVRLAPICHAASSANIYGRLKNILNPEQFYSAQAVEIKFLIGGVVCLIAALNFWIC